MRPTWTRRDVLGGLGVASAHALLWAFGCSQPARAPRRPALEVSGEVRTWLREAVATLAGAGLVGHALAVSRQRTTAGLDVLGAGVAHARGDGVVLTIQQPGGTREQVTSELTQDGIAAAVKALAGKARPGHVEFGAPPPSAPVPRPDPETISDANLLDSIAAIAARDPLTSSRIVYSAGLVDIDDAMVWSVAAGHDLEQRLYRVRRSLVRVAWNGTRPVVSELARAWRGGINDQTFTDAEIAHARETALALTTPGAFEDGTRELVLAPGVVAALVDTAVRGLLTESALRRPEVAQRVAAGAAVGSPVLTLVDDPTAKGAYGGFQFDDAGQAASAVTLIDRGHVVGRVARARRPGHVGPIEAAPSHLRLVAGGSSELVLDDGYRLEGSIDAHIDPSSDRVVLGVQHAVEIKGGKRTGRIYADVELVGELAPLMASISDATARVESVGFRDESDGLPRWRSIEAPFVRGRGTLRARRRHV